MFFIYYYLRKSFKICSNEGETGGKLLLSIQKISALEVE